MLIKKSTKAFKRYDDNNHFLVHSIQYRYFRYGDETGNETCVGHFHIDERLPGNI